MKYESNVQEDHLIDSGHKNHRQASKKGKLQALTQRRTPGFSLFAEEKKAQNNIHINIY